MYIIVYITMYIIAGTNANEAKKKTLALQGFFVEVAGFEPAAFWYRNKRYIFFEFALDNVTKWDYNNTVTKRTEGGTIWNLRPNESAQA